MKKKEINETIKRIDEQILAETEKLNDITDSEEKERQGKLIESLAKAKSDLAKALTEVKYKLPEIVFGGLTAFGTLFAVFSKIYEVWARHDTNRKVIDVEEHGYVNSQALDTKH